MLSSITHILLSFVAKNEQFTNETQSIRRRFQILCLIYTNLACGFIITSFCTLFSIALNDFRIYINLAFSLPVILTSLCLIRTRRLDAAAAALVIIFHLTNLITSELLPFPFVSLISLLIYPYFLLMVTSSIKVMILNAIFCVARFIFLSRRISQIFSVTETEEQFVHICSLMITLFFLICSVSAMSIIQKSMELLVWSSTEENYLKSVNQTKQVMEAMEAKNRFISMISHEIRNPLNAIKGSIDYLGQITTDQNQLKILKSAKIGGEILLNLVNNVLDAAKLKSDKIEIFYDETSLIDILKKVLVVNSEYLKSKELRAQVYLEENLPENLHTDPSRLLQVLMNLFSNAIKFTPVKGCIEIYVSFCPGNSSQENLLSLIRKPRKRNNHQEINLGEGPENNELDTTEEKSIIEIESFTQKLNLMSKFQVKSLEDVYNHASSMSNSRSFNRNNNNGDDPWDIYKMRLPNSSSSIPRGRNGYIKVQISDSGCGISEEDKERLFGMFEQVAEPSRSSEGGSGLGLWICKQLCQRMNGDITLYSEVNNGSSFVFYLPIDGNNEQISHNHNEREIKALIVDDFWTDLYLEKCLLEQEGVKVVTARNGKEAIEKYQQGGGRFDLVLMDMEMGEMAGYIAAMNIRKWEMKNKMKGCEMYLVTGQDGNEREVKKKFERFGGGNVEEVKYLKKPLKAEKMRQIVNEMLKNNDNERFGRNI